MKQSWLLKAGRWLRKKYIRLLRAPGGPDFVARGFSIGIAVEMFTLATYGLAFLLLFPLTRMFKGSFPAALIGFVLGKVIFIPISFLNKRVGKIVIPDHFAEQLKFLPGWLSKYLEINLIYIVGGMIVGTLLGTLLYLPVRYMIHLAITQQKKRIAEPRDDSESI